MRILILAAILVASVAQAGSGLLGSAPGDFKRYCASQATSTNRQQESTKNGLTYNTWCFVEFFGDELVGDASTGHRYMRYGIKVPTSHYVYTDVAAFCGWTITRSGFRIIHDGSDKQKKQFAVDMADMDKISRIHRNVRIFLKKHADNQCEVFAIYMY